MLQPNHSFLPTQTPNPPYYTIYKYINYFIRVEDPPEQKPTQNPNISDFFLELKWAPASAKQKTI